MSLRCRWYIFDWHSSLLFTFYKAQKYKDFLKRPNVWRIFLPYKVEIANCKLQIGFLYVSVCITPKGCLRIVILSAYIVIIYYYNNIINNIIYILYLLIPSEDNKENIEFAICNLQFAIFLGWIIG